MEAYIDTVRLRECKSDLDTYINDLTNNYNELFERLYNIKHTKEWTGLVAERYINSLKNDKMEFMNYISDLKEYSKFLLNVANEYERKINEIRR